jgi:hypothetical protein
MTRRKLAGLLIVIPLTLAAFACDDDDDSIEDTLDDAGTRVSEEFEDARTTVSEGIDDVQTEVNDDEDPQEGGAEGPAVDITAPDDGDTADAGGIEVEVDVSDFDVVDKLGEPPVDGEGHVHFYMDVASVPTTPGQPAVTAEGTYHAEATTSYTWEDVPAGEHTFAVQLVNNDHTPLEPPVVAEVTVTVE